MGAWGVRVLENDRALDVLADLSYVDPYGGTIATITELLLRSRFEEDIVLGATMVLASLTKNKKYLPNTHQEFFTPMCGNRWLKELKSDAINSVYRLHCLGAEAWTEECREERLEYLKELKGALEEKGNGGD